MSPPVYSKSGHLQRCGRFGTSRCYRLSGTQSAFSTASVHTEPWKLTKVIAVIALLQEKLRRQLANRSSALDETGRKRLRIEVRIN
jgi:hypothetical protein